MGTYATNDLKEDEQYREHLGRDVWLMDNHKWAFYVWEQYRHELPAGNRFELVHMDYHWDGINDFSEKNDRDTLIAVKDLAAIEALVTDKNSGITYESFIAPAVIRGLIKKIHFHCLQQNEDAGIDGDILNTYDCEQHFHENEHELVKCADLKGSLICDLCLDLFNKADKKVYEGDLWSDEEIVAYLEAVEPVIKAAAVCTISLSFGYSGTHEDTLHLMQLVVPRILAIRGG